MARQELLKSVTIERLYTAELIVNFTPGFAADKVWQAIFAVAQLAFSPAAQEHKIVEGEPALNVAIKVGQLEMLELLLQAGAEVNYVSSHRYLNPLVVAIESGNLPALKKLMEAGGRISGSHLADFAPLEEAAKAGQTEMVAFILPHTNTKENLAAFIGAVAARQDETALQILQDCPAIINANDELPILSRVAKRASGRIIAALIAAGADLKDLNKAIEVAVQAGNGGAVSALVEASPK